MKQLTLFILISIGFHILFVLPWILLSKKPLPLFGGGGEVSVEIVETPEVQSAQLNSLPTGKPAGREPQIASLPRNDRGAGEHAGPGSGPAGFDAILAEIRARIERAKRYPLLARKSGIEGRSLVRFQIAEDGSPDGVSLKSSSGSRILDDEALATIRRAAPYPSYSDPLEIWIRFQLNP